MNRNRWGAVAALLPLTLLVSGCAFGTRRPELVYPPEGAEEAIVARPEEAALVLAPTIVLAEFTDTRSASEIGEVRNGWGMKTADVVSSTSVPDWMRGALRYELERAGFVVIEGPSPTEGDLVLRGEILTVYCKAMFSYEGEVAFFVEASRGGKRLFRNRYDGQGSEGTNWGATARSYGRSLALALQDALQDVVRDVRAQLAEPSS